MLYRDESPFQPLPSMGLDFRPRSMAYHSRRPLSRRRRDLDAHVQRKRDNEVGAPRLPVPNVERWLGQLYWLCAEKRLDPAIDLVLYTIDDLFLLGQASRCNEILTQVDVEPLPVDVLMAFLMETFRARSVLPERGGFYRRVEEKLRRVAPGRVEALIGRLR